MVGKHKAGLGREYLDRAPAHDPRIPQGPFKAGNEGRGGSLLLFVPRNPISLMIDELSGGYGYSHLAIDLGEVDIPTGKRVMVESTVSLGVHYAFQDEYGERSYVRIPLWSAGVDVDNFCNGVRSRIGQKYDDEEALTLGIIDDPAKQICSDLATVCLPVNLRRDIARCHRAGLIHPLAAVLHGRLDGEFRLFVSPNGFAEYFGAPRGRELTGRDQYSAPVLPEQRFTARRYPQPWKVGLAIVGSLALGYLAFRLISTRRA